MNNNIEAEERLLKLYKNDWKTGVSTRFLRAAKDGKPDPALSKIQSLFPLYIC
jgi:hypothetical protein